MANVEEQILEEKAWQADSPLWALLELPANQEAVRTLLTGPLIPTAPPSAVPWTPLRTRNAPSTPARAPASAPAGGAAGPGVSVSLVTFFKQVVYLAAQRCADLCRRMD